MLTSTEINAETTSLTEVDVLNLISNIRTSDRYKADAAYYVDLKTKIESFEGATEAKLLNAIITKLEGLGSGVVEINQQQTVGTDGVVYSQKLERDALIDYALNIIYEGFYNTTTSDSESALVLKGEYGVGRLTLDYEGYL